MSVAKYIFIQKGLTQKIELVYYLKKKQNLFFDNSVILKTELARMFIDSMCLDVDRNTVLTACLVYSLKKKHVKQNPNELNEEKNKSKEFIKKLGFNKSFAQICSEYNRIGEPKDYKRTPEGDILELVDNFGGMLLHRETRLAFTPKEAIELLEKKNLKGKENRFLEDFKFFVDVMEEASDVGIISKLQSSINRIKRDDIASALRAIYDSRDRIENIFLLSENELFEEQVNFFNLIKIAKKKTFELVEYNKKMKQLGITSEIIIK